MMEIIQCCIILNILILNHSVSPYSFPKGSGLLEFEEFAELASKFLMEEDEEALKKELREAFEIFDKEGT